MFSNAHHVKQLLAKNIELTKLLTIAIQRLGGEQFFSDNELAQLRGKRLEKTTLTNCTIRIAVVDTED